MVLPPPGTNYTLAVVNGSGGGSFTANTVVPISANLLNRVANPWSYGVQDALLSFLLLDPTAPAATHLVIYDRANSHTAGLFKRFNLALTAAPVINSNVVTTLTPGGQNLYVTSLLPAGATITITSIGNALNPIAWLEPSTYRLVIEDPADPTDSRMLHVLQGADAGVAADAATLIQSTSGTAMDGAIIGNTAVLFIVNATQLFAGTSYTVSAGVIQHYLTGCAPGATYAVTAATTASGLTVNIVPSASGIQADSAGVLTLSF